MARRALPRHAPNTARCLHATSFGFPNGPSDLYDLLACLVCDLEKPRTNVVSAYESYLLKCTSWDEFKGQPVTLIVSSTQDCTKEQTWRRRCNRCSAGAKCIVTGAITQYNRQLLHSALSSPESDRSRHENVRFSTNVFILSVLQRARETIPLVLYCTR